jgi:hypothetical protein
LFDEFIERHEGRKGGKSQYSIFDRGAEEIRPLFAELPAQRWSVIRGDFLSEDQETSLTTDSSD